MRRSTYVSFLCLLGSWAWGVPRAKSNSENVVGHFCACFFLLGLGCFLLCALLPCFVLVQGVHVCSLGVLSGLWFERSRWMNVPDLLEVRYCEYTHVYLARVFLNAPVSECIWVEHNSSIRVLFLGTAICCHMYVIGWLGNYFNLWTTWEVTSFHAFFALDYWKLCHFIISWAYERLHPNLFIYG